jgi:hypothetical protein
MTTIEELWTEFDRLGEAAVRRKLILGDFRDTGPHRSAAEEWLRRKDQERLEVRDRSNMTWTRVAAIAAVAACLLTALAWLLPMK